MLISYDPYRSIQYCEISQSEKIHLQEAKSLEWMSRELSHRRRRIFRRWLEWTKIGHRLRGDDHGTRVDSELSDGSLETDRCIDHLGVDSTFFIDFFELVGLLESLPQRDTRTSRDQFSKYIHLFERDSECSTSIFDRCTGSQSTERTYLSHAIGSVFGPDVDEYLISPHIREVDIDIWHRYSGRIEESLKKEPIPQRIDIRDP